MKECEAGVKECTQVSRSAAPVAPAFDQDPLVAGSRGVGLDSVVRTVLRKDFRSSNLPGCAFGVSNPKTDRIACIVWNLRLGTEMECPRMPQGQIVSTPDSA